jgi:hypothetical protein
MSINTWLKILKYRTPLKIHSKELSFFGKLFDKKKRQVTTGEKKHPLYEMIYIINGERYIMGKKLCISPENKDCKEIIKLLKEFGVDN